MNSTAMSWREHIRQNMRLALPLMIGQPFRDSKPFQRLWVMDWAVTARLLRIGVPIGLTIVAEAGIFIAVTFLIGLFGTAALAAGRSPTRSRPSPS